MGRGKIGPHRSMYAGRSRVRPVNYPGWHDWKIRSSPGNRQAGGHAQQQDEQVRNSGFASGLLCRKLHYTFPYG
jgi:hypothetical protein